MKGIPYPLRTSEVNHFKFKGTTRAAATDETVVGRFNSKEDPLPFGIDYLVLVFRFEAGQDFRHFHKLLDEEVRRRLEDFEASWGRERLPTTVHHRHVRNSRLPKLSNGIWECDSNVSRSGGSLPLR